MDLLLNVGPAIEWACKVRLSPILPTFVQRETDDLPAERLDVQCARGAWTGRMLPDSKGVLRDSAWRYTLTLKFQTVRRKDEPDRHGLICGNVEASLAGVIMDPLFLQYHAIASIDLQSATESIQDEDRDVSALTFTGIVTVRSDAMGQA